MKRKIVLRAIAIIFMALGLWYLGLFFWPLIDVTADKNLNPVYLVFTAFLFQSGFDLFRLKESGRKLVLFLLSIRAIVNLSLLAWSLFPQSDNFSFFIIFLGKPFLNSENLSLFVVIILAWVLVVLLMMAFLLQRETREIFVSKANEIASEPKVVSTSG
jgi:hypothetical protein